MLLLCCIGGIPTAGRKPKPTALKKLEGNPGKRKLNTKEPVPGKGMPDCPKWLLPVAKEEWNVGGKVNLPPHGKEFFRAAVSTFLHPAVSTFLHRR